MLVGAPVVVVIMFSEDLLAELLALVLDLPSGVDVAVFGEAMFAFLADVGGVLGVHASYYIYLLAEASARGGVGLWGRLEAALIWRSLGALVTNRNVTIYLKN